MTWNLQQINSSGASAAADPFVSVFSNQQHVGYRDSEGTIWDSWYDPTANTWKLQKINAGGNTTGPAAIAGPSIGVYTNQQHFAYVDTNGNIWDSWYDGDANTWKLQKINAGGNTSGPTASGRSEMGDIGPVSIWVAGSQQHFTYLGMDSVVYDAFWDTSSNSWHLQKINAGGNTTGPLASSFPFACVFNGQQHIGYVDDGGDIWDSWYDPGANQWKLQKINDGGNTSGPKAMLGNQPFIWVNPATQQHFTYRGQDSAVYDAFWDANSSSWHLQKINAGGNTTGPLASSAPFACAFNGQQHIGYVDDGGNIWDSFYDPDANQWRLQKINDGGNTTGPAAVSSNHVFIWNAFGTQQHFTYRDGSGKIWDAFWNSTPPTPPPTLDVTVTPTEISVSHHCNLNPPDGVIEGPVNATITKDGSFNFTGQLNSSCWGPYNVSLAVTLTSKSGTTFVLAENSGIGAGSGPASLGANNNLNWDNNGTNSTIAAVWGDLQAECRGYYDANVNVNITEIWNDLQTAVGDVSKVVALVGAI
jgi:hypothetical protein